MVPPLVAKSDKELALEPLEGTKIIAWATVGRFPRIGEAATVGYE